MKKYILIAMILFNSILILKSQSIQIHMLNGSISSFPLSLVDSITFTTSNVSNYLPTVTTDTVTNLSTIATSGGNVLSDGGSFVMHKGVCWDTLPNSTVNGLHTQDAFGVGPFTSHFTNWSYGKIYYLRAYAVNNFGVAYGNQVQFSLMYSNVTIWKSNSVQTNIRVYTSTNSTNVHQQSNYKGTITTSYLTNPGCDAVGCVTFSATPNSTIYYYGVSSDSVWTWNGSMNIISGACNTMQFTIAKKNELIEQNEILIDKQSFAIRNEE